MLFLIYILYYKEKKDKKEKKKIRNTKKEYYVTFLWSVKGVKGVKGVILQQQNRPTFTGKPVVLWKTKFPLLQGLIDCKATKKFVHRQIYVSTKKIFFYKI